MRVPATLDYARVLLTVSKWTCTYEATETGGHSIEACFRWLYIFSLLIYNVGVCVYCSEKNKKKIST
jgi:hypothetical protein